MPDHMYTHDRAPCVASIINQYVTVADMGDLSLSPGASECTSCPDYSDSPAGSRSCLCNAGYFEHNITYAYWDVGDCGPNGDDARWSWCDQRNFICQQEVITDECDSGFAKLKSTQGNEQSLKSGSVTIQGCGYHYFAIYECTGIFKLVYGTCICTFIAAVTPGTSKLRPRTS